MVRIRFAGKAEIETEQATCFPSAHRHGVPSDFHLELARRKPSAGRSARSNRPCFRNALAV